MQLSVLDSEAAFVLSMATRKAKQPARTQTKVSKWLKLLATDAAEGASATLACKLSGRYLQSAQELVNEELHVLVGQLLELDDVVEVGAHQVGHQVAATKGRAGHVGGRGELGKRTGAAMATARHLHRRAFPQDLLRRHPPTRPPAPLNWGICIGNRKCAAVQHRRRFTVR